MIGRLRGTLLAKQPPALLLDVAGVGYELEAPMSTFYELGAVGSEATLHTHLHVREDAFLLYGFFREGERALFRQLIKLSGIGAKMALAVLSGMSVDDFRRCVATADVSALTRVPGIGKKTAERIVMELKDRVDGAMAGVVLPSRGSSGPLDPAGEALVAMQALGYKPVEAARLVEQSVEPGDNAETIIRKALKRALRN
jgi:Holliday junction DNA helicase RuvA